MMKKIFLFTILVLIVILSYSQNYYPQKIVLNNDTLILITPNQLKEVNFRLLKLNSQSEYLEDVETYLFKLQEDMFKQSSLNEKLISKNNNLFVQNSELIKINNTNNKIQEYYKKEIKNYKKKQIKVAIVGGLVGISVTSILFLTLN
jgi:hypothetical protein